jgi:hypothetical protein
MKIRGSDVHRDGYCTAPPRSGSFGETRRTKDPVSVRPPLSSMNAELEKDIDLPTLELRYNLRVPVAFCLSFFHPSIRHARRTQPQHTHAQLRGRGRRRSRIRTRTQDDVDSYRCTIVMAAYDDDDDDDDDNPLVRALFQREPIEVIRWIINDTLLWLRHRDGQGMLPINRIFDVHPLPDVD